MKRDKEGPTENCTTKSRDQEHFGVCPFCGKTDGFFNIGRDHWFFCHAHRLLWWGGANLFSSWRHETPEDWQKNREQFRSYKEVIWEYED